MFDRTESQCTCTACKSMCRNSPCFPTPQEAITLIQRGYQSRLQLTFYGDPATKRPYVVVAPQFTEAGCVFQDKRTGLCELHTLGLKPMEGRLAHHSMTAEDRTRVQVCNTWHNNLGASVIRSWPEPDPERKQAAVAINHLNAIQYPF